MLLALCAVGLSSATLLRMRTSHSVHGQSTHSGSADGASGQKSATGTGALPASDATLSASLKSIYVPQWDAERRFLEDAPCANEMHCYGPLRFRWSIFERYPDIAKIRYEWLNSGGVDASTLAARSAHFYTGLYLAKQITLADGQTLYDFMRHCAKDFSEMDGADINHDSRSWTAYFDVRYFPRLRRSDSGAEIELQLLFVRYADRLATQSGVLAEHMLSDPDFMRHQGLICWNQVTAKRRDGR